jgi:hypothetical protein
VIRTSSHDARIEALAGANPTDEWHHVDLCPRESAKPATIVGIGDGGDGAAVVPMALATAVSLVEVGLAATVLWFRTRRAAQAVIGKPIR